MTSSPLPATALPAAFVRIEKVGRVLARTLLFAGWTTALLSVFLLVTGQGGRNAAGWMVHGGCFAWDPKTMGVWIVGNVGTAACYAVIPALLFHVRRLQSLPVWIIASFETFILFCGTGHLVKVWTLWHSDYVAAGALDLATFLVSVPAAIGLGLTIWQARLSKHQVAEALGRADNAEAARDLLLERLQASNADLERFAHAASHDLQEPLRAVQSYADLVLEDYAPQLDEQGRRWLDNVQKNAARAQRMVRDLLSFSRHSVEGVEFESVPLREPLDEAVGRLAMAIDELGAELTIAELPTVVGDRAQLALVFQNLIGNALKYRGESAPRVEIQGETTDEEIIVRVLDAGVGIPVESRDSVFEVFGRLQSETDVPGTGLGLAMCRRVAERHGARVGVVDWPDGRTCFELRFKRNGGEA